MQHYSLSPTYNLTIWNYSTDCPPEHKIFNKCHAVCFGENSLYSVILFAAASLKLANGAAANTANASIAPECVTLTVLPALLNAYRATVDHFDEKRVTVLT